MSIASDDLFGAVLSDIANGPSGARDNLTEALLRRLHEKGLTLAQCADKRIMKRSVGTLQKYARQFDLAFPDYIPQKLRPKKEKKRKAAVNV